MRPHDRTREFLHIIAHVQQPSWPLPSTWSVLHVALLLSSGVGAMLRSEVTLMTMRTFLWGSNLPTKINTGGSAVTLPVQHTSSPYWASAQGGGAPSPNPKGVWIKGNQSAFILIMDVFLVQYMIITMTASSFFQLFLQLLLIIFFIIEKYAQILMDKKSFC